MEEKVKSLIKELKAERLLLEAELRGLEAKQKKMFLIEMQLEKIISETHEEQKE